jgi:hydrogenase-4 component H
MFKTIKGIIKTGNATIAYPFAPLERPKDVRGKPEHESLACIACAACATACPSNALQMRTNLEAGTISWSINYGRCVFCGRCEEVCPTRAMRLSAEFELAVMRKEDLEEVCTYRLHACDACGAYYASDKEIDYARQILGKSANSEETRHSLELLTVCPQCKNILDAKRAQALRQGEEGQHVYRS